MFYLVSFLIVVLVVVTACSSFNSGKKQPGTGMINDRLRSCPSSPNCVCSEFSGLASSIPPLTYTVEHNIAWDNAVAVVLSMGGRIITSDEKYLHATFTSRIFRFVDDFELRLDKENKVIHLRSASRTGYSDLGVNRKRVNQFRTQFEKMLR